MINLDSNKYEAFIFDMDGTMVDNMMVHHHAWQQKLKEMGMEMTIEEVMEKVHGINEEIIEGLFPGKFSDSEVKKHAADKEIRYREIFRDSLQLIEGLPAFMQILRENGIPMAVGSAAPPENVDFVLDNLDIRSSFEAVLHSKDVTKGKPDPEIYQKIMQRLKVSSENTVIFEDSVVGAKAAENAACDVVIITTTHRPEEFAGLSNIMGFADDFTTIKVS
jgi:beta-phosphoglucomutase